MATHIFQNIFFCFQKKKEHDDKCFSLFCYFHTLLLDINNDVWQHNALLYSGLTGPTAEAKGCLFLSNLSHAWVCVTLT